MTASTRPALSSSCRYYPDHRTLDDDALAAHHLQAGRKNHRVAQRLRVVMSYQAAGLEPKLYGGLCNQIYVHVGMLAVAARMGAEAVRGGLVRVPSPAASTCAQHHVTHLGAAHTAGAQNIEQLNPEHLAPAVARPLRLQNTCASVTEACMTPQRGNPVAGLVLLIACVQSCRCWL